MAAEKYLIVNADDFGQSCGVNRGIIEAHERGILTSASLMTRWPAAGEAALYAKEHPKLSLGLHVDFGEWAYRNAAWVPLYKVVPLEHTKSVEAEVFHQLTTFRRLLGKNPTHIDSHQHFHLREPARAIVVETAHNIGVPLRHCSSKVRYCGDFYGQSAEGAQLPELISVDHLLTILAALPTGCTELGCHPGEGNDLETMYVSERAKEVKVLCDPRVRAAIAAMEIELWSFNDIVIGSTGEKP